MDDYPAFSLDLSVPLLLTLGIAPDTPYESPLGPDLKEQAILLRSELPLVDSEQAKALLRYFQASDASNLPWNGRDEKRTYRFRVRAAERTLLLPPRQARLPENLEAPEAPVLHSPFSPLSPICSLYPDGLLNERWLQKHGELVPSVLICFYNLTSDPTLTTLDDNKIKTDVNHIRSLLSKYGYRTRLAVVLISDKAPSSVEGVQERLENIQRGCGVDQKALFLVPPKDSQDALERSADTVLAAIYAQSLEYYRDMGRHSRKKRGRGVAPQPTVPPTSGTSQTLSLAGWNVRYDFKSALFSEYRQEMDGALRSYEQAYETLMGPELFETIPSWSPRWNEARYLADVIAIRCLRCLLWNGLPSGAVRRWQAHRDKIRDLVDRRGRGTNNYGWAAWEARWAAVMAELIEKVDIPELSTSATSTLFLQPEKTLLSERLQPWERLHHQGYWYHLASRHQYLRRTLAHTMPEEDRRSPSDSPASQVASKAFTYDTYMCPDPHDEYPLRHSGTDHGGLIIDALMRSLSEFKKRKQHRFVAEVSLECARELSAKQDWGKIVELLRPLWNDTSFRSEGWMSIAEELSWSLRRAASKAGEAELVVAIDWELLNRSYTRHPNWNYDITKSLEGISSASRPTVSTEGNSPDSLLVPCFVFKHEEGKAGQTTRAQLSITSHAMEASTPLVLHSLQIHFEGSIKTIALTHEPNATSEDQAQGHAVLQSVSLKEVASEDVSDRSRLDELDKIKSLDGSANLTIAPGRTAIFEMDIPLREPGTASAASLRLSLQTESFDLEHTAPFRVPRSPSVWYNSATAKKRVSRANPLAVRILPRPPKMEIKTVSLMDQYYTSEALELEFEVLNAEDADASVKLDAALFGESPPEFIVKVGEEAEEHASAPEGEESRVIGAPLGQLESSQAVKFTARINAIQLASRYEFTVRTSYHLSTDPATLITQTAVFELNIVNPFEANYDLLPRLHPDPWPSLFDYDNVVDQSGDNTLVTPSGLSQTWCLITRYASFASEDLRVVELDLSVHPSPSIRTTVTNLTALSPDGLRVSPKTIEEASFNIAAQKTSLDDRIPSSLDVSFLIKWTRPDAPADATPNTTILPVPRLHIFNTEPRVLATASYITPDIKQKLLVLDIVIENASNHLLTFGLSMEPSDDFAFSGAKQTTLHLLPVSRRSVTYRLLPVVRGTWLKPGLVVRDKYFQKVLRVIPTEGMKLDKEGFLVWIPPEDDGE
ncbi:hypothetical protein GQ53DRAFT_661530 [Thozetella sp. PMI_491]|nr:hypothetical protein GQ53DRAFT_661530 [Thozetella sp. PMI_491]